MNSLLELQDLSLGYGTANVLSDLALTVERGRWVALVGPNASGKSTLLRCIAGRHAPRRGVVRIDGNILYATPPLPRTLPGFAIAPEELPPFLTIQQSLEIHANAHGLAGPPPESLVLAAMLGLDAHAGKLIRHVSLGTRQKLAVVLALMRRPTLLLLDEVFNGLDFSSTLKLRKHLRELVDREGMTILLATHSLDVVLQCCDELVLLDSGKLARRWAMSEFSGNGALAALEGALAAAV